MRDVMSGWDNATPMTMPPRSVASRKYEMYARSCLIFAVVLNLIVG